jgi:hypothetical protein
MSLAKPAGGDGRNVSEAGDVANGQIDSPRFQCGEQARRFLIQER